MAVKKLEKKKIQHFFFSVEKMTDYYSLLIKSSSVLEIPIMYFAN